MQYLWRAGRVVLRPCDQTLKIVGSILTFCVVKSRRICGKRKVPRALILTNESLDLAHRTSAIICTIQSKRHKRHKHAHVCTYAIFLSAYVVSACLIDVTFQVQNFKKNSDSCETWEKPLSCETVRVRYTSLTATLAAVVRCKD